MHGRAATCRKRAAAPKQLEKIKIFQNMRKKIKEKIEQKRIESEFQIQIQPRHNRRKQHPDYVAESLRDENGNHIDKEGNLILSHIRAADGKTLTPREQYLRSRFNPNRRQN